MTTPRALAELPTLGRYVVVGALWVGIPGCVVGLVVGLRVYAPTAWFAVFEVGIPAAVLGGLLGLAVGSVRFMLNRLRNARHP
ncbi:MAG: hypothetical protein ACRDPG_09845 [Nocardioidaceae bacterium]